MHTVAKRATLHQLLTTVIFSNVQPSSTATAPSNSAAVNDGLENKNAQRSGDDKGVKIIIGVAGGGAVVLGICIIMIIVYCKRRKSRYVLCETSFPKQPIVY